MSTQAVTVTGISAISPGPIANLSDDIIDRILTFLTAFPSLFSLILSSKSIFYVVFKARQRTILHAVAENVLDNMNGFGPTPSLTDATRTTPLAREVIYAQISKKEGKAVSQIVDDLLREASNERFSTTVMELEESKRVSKIAFAAQFLENWFSICYKDRTHAQSQLTLIESRRFQQSLFRIWLPLLLLANDPLTHSNTQSTTATLDSPTVKSVGRLFERFNEATLKEMMDIFRFLGMVGNWTYRADKKLAFAIMQTARMDSNAICLPDVLVQRIIADEAKYTSWNDLRINFQPGILLFPSPWAVISQLFKIHKIIVPFPSDMISPVILGPESSRVEEIQACQKCMNQNYKLWSETNWFLLRGVLFLSELDTYLPGRTSRNRRIREELMKRLAPPHALEDMLRSMYDNENDPQGCGWDRTKFYCRGCLKTFIGERIFSWMVRQRTKEGHQELPECWYGWNCRTQTHKAIHMDAYEHLCRPRSDKDDRA